jgi:hypothetical protein
VKVTFDTNTLDRVVRPERFSRDARRAEFVKVHEAVVAGRLKGFFSETTITLEGIENADRAAVLGSTRHETRLQENTDQDGGRHTIQVNVAVKQNRKPLHPEQIARIQAAMRIGMRALRAPARVGWIRTEDPTGRLFAPDGSEERLAERLDRTAAVIREIESRGLGYAQVASLGKKFAERDKVDEPWLLSLRRARDVHERNRVKRAIAEWADADPVASHIGYGIDLLCTEDTGKGAGGQSVLDANNRTWLAVTHHLKFVTLWELARLTEAL